METNVIPLPVEQATTPQQSRGIKQRFKIVPFLNRGGTESFRVTGTTRQGKQIRDNFPDLKSAECRQIELMADWHGRQVEDTSIRATKLSAAQLRIAEVCFVRLDADADLYLAVEHWLKHGKQHAVAESPKLDDAVTQFKEWVEATDSLRQQTKWNLNRRVDLFAGSTPNVRICDITADSIDDFLDKRTGSGTTKDNDRRAVSRFFSWCMDRKRRWTTVNPCHAVKVEKGQKPKPSILNLDECKKLLTRAEEYEAGLMAPYFAVCLFGGLRPFEAMRLTPAQVNLTDREIRLESWQTKTKEPRVVKICDTLFRWLEKYKDRSFFPPAWRKHFIAVELAAGYGPKLKSLPPDIMRHTAVSHFFRKTGSYGQTAEQFGNSEAIIKKHYQGRVSSADTTKFYALRPNRGAGAKSQKV